MKPYFRLSILFLFFLGWTAGAQTSREELLTHIELTAGNYANYPVPTGHLTPAPEGYEPFYISHYGRHGARYMTSDRAYRRLQKLLDTAQFLGIQRQISRMYPNSTCRSPMSLPKTNGSVPGRLSMPAYCSAAASFPVPRPCTRGRRPSATVSSVSPTR